MEDILKRIWRKLPFEDSEGRNALENLIKGYKEKEEELEKYKKIAEKLAEEIDKITEEIAREKGIEDFEFCDERCHNKEDYIECKQCIIEWARKEVENE